MRCSLHECIKRRGAKYQDIHSRQFSKILLWIRDGGWEPIFGSQKFLVHFFKAISYIEVVIRIIRITRTKIVTPRGVSINRGLTRRGQGQGHGTRIRTALGRFINTGNIHSLMGWETRTITVVWQQIKTKIESKIISAGNIYNLIRRGW